MQTEIARKKILLQSLLNLAYLWSRARLAINKNQIYFLLPEHQLAENVFLLLVSIKGQKENKSEFISKFVNLSEILCKFFPTQCFFTDHLKHKALNKQLVERPQQTFANYVPISWRALQLLWLCFEAFRISWFIPCLITFKFS